MTTFLAVALIALALKVAIQVIEELVPSLKTQQSIVTVALSIGTAYALNYSLFNTLGVPLRNENVEKVVTGIALAGMITVWNAVLAYLGSKSGSSEASSRGTHRLAA
jgi:hypothetical protein